MGIFEDFSRVLETRLDEFLKNNPHLELQALDEQLREQEAETTRLLASFRIREKQLETDILNTAKDVQRWHQRIEKAKAANRYDLVKPAEEREAVLLRQGNQLWGQMNGVKERIKQTVTLNQQVKQRRQEVRAKIAQAETSRAAAQSKQWQTAGWNQSPDYTVQAKSNADDLEQAFIRWETDEELNQMKRDLGR